MLAMKFGGMNEQTHLAPTTDPKASASALTCVTMIPVIGMSVFSRLKLGLSDESSSSIFPHVTQKKINEKPTQFPHPMDLDPQIKISSDAVHDLESISTIQPEKEKMDRCVEERQCGCERFRCSKFCCWVTLLLLLMWNWQFRPKLEFVRQPSNTIKDRPCFIEDSRFVRFLDRLNENDPTGLCSALDDLKIDWLPWLEPQKGFLNCVYVLTSL